MDDSRVQPQRILFVVSDFHLGEGSTLPDGRANRLEDFPVANETLFIGMLRDRLAALPEHVPFTLVFNGDTFDYHAVRFDGRFGIVPTEEAAVVKTAAILRGHPKFCAGLKGLLAERPTMTVEILDGNHDPELNRPAVQELIRAALAPDGQGHRVAFREEILIGDALISHSDEIDPLSANPPTAEMFKRDVVVSRAVMAGILALSLLLMGTVASLTFAWVPYTFAGMAVGTLLSFAGVFLVLRWCAGRLPFLWSRETDVMDVPFASYLNAGAGMRIKRWFLPDIGRREDHGDEWILAIATKIYVLPLILPLLLLFALSHRFFHLFRRPREKFSMRTFWQLIANTTHPDRVERERERFLKKRPEVGKYVTGHTHVPKVETVEVDGRTVVYLNTGTGIRQVRMLKPPVTVTTSWPRVETFFKRVLFLWKHAPHRAFLSTLAYAVVPAGLFALSFRFGWEIGPWHWSIAAAALFLLLWWQFAAEYRGRTFIEFTPAEVVVSADGPVQARLLRYDHESRRFADFMTGEPYAA